jgi:NAD+ synthase (glutamine-hydrolysing)
MLESELLLVVFAGPELEITGYGCEDHFFEQDTFLHSWESIAKLLQSDLTDGT